jgi:8-oxo-dGTP pyrophosphatase MutT (NUDIX family)
MHSAVMGARLNGKNETRLAIAWTRVGKRRSSAKFVRLAELRRLKECEQVAAVCYRRRGDEIRFLLVKTDKERWIFPKGSVEPGLTHAQAAALEAFEEAGVHGRMEESSFTSYVRSRRRELRNSAGRSNGRSAEKEPAVNAHLCEVLRLVAPLELGRNPTWFSPEKAKRRLQEDRTTVFGAELSHVIDRAVLRIRRFRTQDRAQVRVHPARAAQVRGSQSNGLHKVQFIDIARVQQAARRVKTPRTG